MIIYFYNNAYYNYFGKDLPNNTFFMSFKRYNEQQDYFEEVFRNEFKSDFAAFFSELKKRYAVL